MVDGLGQEAVARTCARLFDLPVRQVLPDLAILGIAQKHPANANELAQSRARVLTTLGLEVQ